MERLRPLVEESFALNGLRSRHVHVEPWIDSTYHVLYRVPPSGQEDVPSIWCHYLLDLNRRMSYRGGIAIAEDFRGQGYGRKLVAARELVCARTGVDLIVINACTNPSFWKHFDYVAVGPRIMLPSWRSRAKDLERMDARLCMSSRFKAL